MNFNVLTDITVFILFIIAVVAVGLIKSRGEAGSEGYFLAGRGLTWWLIGISLIAANISTEQFVGMSGSAAGISGLAIASYEWMAAITLVFVAFLFLPKFLKSGIYTVPQFLEYRFDAFSRTIMSVLMVVVLVLVNITAVIYSGATVADTVFGHRADIPIEINTATACWTIGVIAAIYVCAGGLKACAWADLLQGTALIVGGGLIAYFAFDAFAAKDVAQIATTRTIDPSTLAGLKDAGVMEKFMTLNADKLTMFMPSDHKEIPWTALIIGLWIPNFYYWGFNQYIIQRTLGASSLAEGQKGIMFAAGLKLIIPFIIVIPGIIAFNLFAHEQALSDKGDQKILTENAKAYSTIYFDSLDSRGIEFDSKAAEKDFTYELGRKDSAGNPVKVAVLSASELKALRDSYDAAKKDGSLYKRYYVYDNGWAELNSGSQTDSPKALVDAWNKKHVDSRGDKSFEQTLFGYKYDSAFGLLISKVLPEGFGLRGFIFAALLGAVVSSLAAMLNAASTIFSIDIYKKFIRPSAGDRHLVIVGRVAVILFALIGCFVAPMLGNPKFGGVFTFIQEFQGYLSPGILAVFIFGMFSRRAPRFSGAVGMLMGPVIYFILQHWFGDIAFLNRIAITFALTLVLMLVMTLVKPLKQDVSMPVNENMNLESSAGAKIAGVSVLAVSIALYVAFSGLFIK